MTSELKKDLHLKTETRQPDAGARSHWQKARASWLNRDLLWPSIEYGDPQLESEKSDSRNKEAGKQLECITDSKEIDEAIVSLQRLVDDETERQHRVETRLAGTLGFAAVAATIALGVAGGAIVKLWVSLHLGAKAPLVILTIYIAAQLFLISRASIRGLERRNYWVLTPSHVLPRKDEIADDRKRRHALDLVKLLNQHQEVNSRKVDAMVLAHLAARNYFIGLVSLTIFGLGVHLLNAAPGSNEHLIREGCGSFRTG